jgi:hypothetical protein
MTHAMTYDRFVSEDELLKSVLPYGAYPKVSAIAGRRINPDIDALEFYKISQNQYRLNGYEMKLIKFDERSKSLGWDAFYKGIGEALLYLKNGVQRTNLILGFHQNIPDDRKIEEFRQLLWGKKELLARIFGRHMSLGMALYKRGNIGKIVEATSDFLPQDEDIEFLTRALIQKHFTYDKKLRRS